MALDRIISADSHVFEPDDLWVRTLGKKWGDAVPRRVHGRPDDPGDHDYDFTGLEYVRKFRRTNLVNEQRGVDVRSAGWDPAVRVKCMEQDGVAAELLGPTAGLFIYSAKNAALVRDCFRVYNDWVAEYCSHAPKRLLRVALIHMADVDAAVADLEKAGRDGAPCVMINGDTQPEWRPYRDTQYDPFWARAQEMGMPVQLHILTGNKRHPLMLKESERGNIARMHLDFANDIGLVLANEFIFGGIFDRFPGLKIVIGEYEVSWVPFWMFRSEQLHESFAKEYGMQSAKRRPREYLSQIYFGVVDDPNIAHVQGIVEPDHLLWGSDFPHARNTFPNSHAIVKRAFAHLGEKGTEAAAYGNSARLFGI